MAAPIMVRNQLIGLIAVANKKSGYDNNDKIQINRLCEYISPLLYSKQKEEQYKQDLMEAKEKAEESDRLKSAFLANMSHEIRTPMNGILGFADLLKEPDLKSENRHKYLEIIEKSGVRMLNIINDIVDISKIEAGQIELNMGESNIAEQIEYVYTFFKPEAEAKKIRLSYTNPMSVKGAIIKTDREKVYAILTNLVKNALKYTEKGSIELGYNLKTRGESNVLEFYIKDTGIGISEDRQEAIFERFIQADIADKMAYQGAGLGLAISKAYVEMLGGEIWVESEEGKGTTFYFTLPYKTDHQETDAQNVDESAREKKDQVKNLKILIVEDDDLSAMLMSEYVQTIGGKEILQAGNDTEAVKICKNHPDIDLILMDIKMPEMGGHEATKQIREFNKEVVIIAATADGLTGDREKSVESGCSDHLAKPISKTELQALIQKYFGKG
ncbi:MAG: ATP-binding protein [Bacteroidales bacterium]